MIIFMRYQFLKYFIMYYSTGQILSDAIVNWEEIVHKNVRSKDGQDAGNVDAIMVDIVVITTQGDRREYRST